MKLKFKTIEKLQNVINNKGNWVFCQYFDNFDWLRCWGSARPTVEFIDKFKNKVSWDYLSKNKLLSKFIVDKYSDKLDWHLISYNHVLNSYFVNTYLDKLNLAVVLDRALKLTSFGMNEDTLCKINNETLKVIKLTLEMDNCTGRKYDNC